MIDFDNKEADTHAKFESGMIYKCPKSGFWNVKGEVKFLEKNETILIDWEGIAENESEALKKALVDFVEGVE